MRVFRAKSDQKTTVSTTRLRFAGRYRGGRNGAFFRLIAMSKKTMNRLTEVQVRKDKPRKGFYKISEGGGMYLLMHHNGWNYWRINYPGLREAFSFIFTTPQLYRRLMVSKSSAAPISWATKPLCNQCKRSRLACASISGERRFLKKAVLFIELLTSATNFYATFWHMVNIDQSTCRLTTKLTCLQMSRR